MNSIRSKQVIITGAIVLLVGFLFTRDIKGLVKPKDENTQQPSMQGASMAAGQTAEISLEEVSQKGKNEVSTGLAAEIDQLEKSFDKASGSERIKMAKELADTWDEGGQFTPGALYLEKIAEQTETLQDWVSAGEHFLKAFDNTQDSLLSPALLQKANIAFTNAMGIDSTNFDAKTGLGITIVNGMGMPMKGIGLLMDVVRQDPKNLKANMNLGTFAIKSGQFDKAIDRFKTVISVKASPEAYFYLATAYENLGENKEAITAYLESKRLAGNPTLSKFIDEKVSALQSKN